MYIKRSLDPAIFVNKFSKWYKALQNKYYFDDLYVGKGIQKGLLPFNNLLSNFDSNFYDKYLIDGWAVVIRQLYRLSNFIDNLFVDKILVDGTGTSVRFFNVILRTIQNGKIQFYIFVLFLVLASYIYRVSNF
jgi:NADH-quinone oxidoreductase subunit L